MNNPPTPNDEKDWLKMDNNFSYNTKEKTFRYDGEKPKMFKIILGFAKGGHTFSSEEIEKYTHE